MTADVDEVAVAFIDGEMAQPLVAASWCSTTANYTGLDSTASKASIPAQAFTRVLPQPRQNTRFFKRREATL
jgi:hypothetical protein